MAARAMAEQPIGIRQTVAKNPCTDVVAHLPGSDEQVEWTSLAVADGVQFRVHSTLGSADQAAAPPFLTPRLDAVR